MSRKNTLHYIAGLFDAEGSIVLNKKCLDICLTSTTLSFVELMKNTFGGTICMPKKRKEHHKQSYLWHSGTKNGFQFCLDMYPYIQSRNKKHRVKFILENYYKNRTFFINNWYTEKDNSIKITIPNIYTSTSDIPEHLLHYITGLIDGDGSICLSKLNRNKSRCPNLCLENTDEQLTLILKNTLGGWDTIVHPKNPKHKIRFRWSLGVHRTISTLEKIKDLFLEPVKNKRANLIVNRYRSIAPLKGPYSEELRIQRTLFEEEFFSYS